MISWLTMQSSEAVVDVTLVEGEVVKQKKKFVYPRCIAHNKIEKYCVPCGGKQPNRKRCLEHDRIVGKCVRCGDKPQANRKCLDHNRIKKYCVECGGTSIYKDTHRRCTDHNKQARFCIPCGGKKKIYKGCKNHNKQGCVQCGYATHLKCPHGRKRSECIPCDGAGICRHKRVRYDCLPCNGSNFCRHAIRYKHCSDCDGSYLCSSCYMTTVKIKGALCRRCDPIAITRSPVKEANVSAHLSIWAAEAMIPIYDSWNKTAIGSSTAICGAFRPDFIWSRVTHSVVLEVDEHQHSSYNPKCEFQRMCNLIGAFGEPIVIVRYNPDSFNIAGERFNTRRDYRLPLLLQRLQHALDTPPSALITVEYLYYSQQSKEHIQRFSFQEQSCMAKWIDDLEPKWDEISMASAIEAATKATTTPTHTPI